MANWIKAIYFVVILAWVIYVLSDDAVKYESFPRRFGLSVALTVIIGLAGFALWHAAVPTSIKLLSEDSEVAESHSLASLKTGSHLDGKAALSFGYLTEQDEYVVMMRQKMEAIVERATLPMERWCMRMRKPMMRESK